MLSFTTPAEPKPVEREPLFALDGVTYTIPKRFTPSDMLMYAHAVRHFGNDQAVSWALEAALGSDGYSALLGAGDAIGHDDFGKLIAVVTYRMLGLDAEVPGPKEDETATAPAEDSEPTVYEPPDHEVWPEEPRHAAG
jgi:hypothetical protein